MSRKDISRYAPATACASSGSTIASSSDCMAANWKDEGGRSAGVLQFVAEHFSQLGDLGADDHPAIRLVRIQCEVILMVIFRCIKDGGGSDLGHDRRREDVRIVE